MDVEMNIEAIEPWGEFRIDTLYGCCDEQY